MSEQKILKSDKAVLGRALRFQAIKPMGTGNQIKWERDWQAGQPELPASPHAPLDLKAYQVKTLEVTDPSTGVAQTYAVIEHNGKKHGMPLADFERLVPYNKSRRLYTTA